MIAPSDYMFQFATIALNTNNDHLEYGKNIIEDYSLENYVGWDYLINDPLTTKFILEGGFDLAYPEFEDSPEDLKIFLDDFNYQFYLVDGWGIIRAIYNNENFSVSRVLADINLLKKEIDNSSGAAKLVYDAAHLFGCYYD